MKRLALGLCFALPVSWSVMAQSVTIDPMFNAGGSGFDDGVRSTSIQPDGKIIVGGWFTQFNGTARNRIARLNADGSLDATFDPGTGFDNSVHTTTLQPDGRIIVGGEFTDFNGTPRGRIARLNTDGTSDPMFNPGTGFDDVVYTTTVQSNGMIIVGGYFSDFNGTPQLYLTRINAGGGLDNTFNGVLYIDDVIYTSALQSDGKIIVGGDFTDFNFSTRNKIARLEDDGNLDYSFDPGAGFDATVEAVSIQPDGKIIVGGWFTDFDGTMRNSIARLNADGTLDNTFDPGAGFNGAVLSTSLQPDGKIIVGGAFTEFDGTPRNYIARLNADGTLDNTFDPGAGFSFNTFPGTVFTTDVQTDGKIIAGGVFNNFDGTEQNRITRLMFCEATSGTDTVATCDAYTWNAQTYTTSGTYTDTLTTINGCDSIVTLSLTIHTAPFATVTYNGDSTITASSGDSYQWINCETGNPIPGATSQTVHITDNGNYAVIISDANCSDTSTCININDLSVNEAPGTQIQLMPNPATDYVSIQISVDSGILNVRDIQGKLILNQTVKNGEIIDLSALHSGLYLFEVITGSGTTVKRLVKQ